MANIRFRITFISVGLLLLAAQGYGEEQTINLDESSKIKLDIPKSWTPITNFKGFPLMIFGPETDRGRATFSLVPTQVSGVSFDPKNMEKAQKGYQEGREAWLKSYGGKLIKFIPYRYDHLKSGVDAHILGFQYELDHVHYTDSTYYIFCSGQMYVGKSLISESDPKESSSELERTLRSFSCG